MNHGTTDKNALRKRSKARFAQMKLIRAMADLRGDFSERYESTLHCSATLMQHGQTITARYCGHRWCRVCNRIRTGKLINGYQSEIESMTDCTFLTLTIPNVPGYILRDSIIEMTATIRKMQDARRKNKLQPIRCIRKIECTYNPDRNDFHPHFHFLVDNATDAQYMIDKWLKYYPTADPSAQDSRPADSPLELFKYFAKLTSKSKEDKMVLQSGKVIRRDEWHYPEALDIIFQSMYGLRVIQPMGGIKIVNDEIDEIQSEVVEDIHEDTVVWIWHHCDWVNPHTGEMLTEYRPTEKELKYRERIRYLHHEKI